jgi:eukaryotic-like serine/threonine-protein kinase
VSPRRSSPAARAAPRPPSRPPTAPPPSALVPPSDGVAFVQNYYGLLPGDTDSAWQLLGPNAQSQSGDQSDYDAFWAEVATVSLQNVRQTGTDTVEGTVVFTRRNGSTSSEPYRFVLGTGSGGQTIMQSFSRL